MALTRPRAYQIYDIDYKQAVRVVTISNITLSGGAPNSVDGVNLSLNDRVLVTGQTNGVQNGIYYVTTLGSGSNGTWTRSIDTDATGELLSGTIVMVTEGTAYADTQWKLTTNDPITIDVTSLTFVQNYLANSISFGQTSFAIGSSNANATVSVAGTSNVAVYATTGEYITGLISATGNVIGENITTAGQVSATANITGGNILTGGLISATSNITSAANVAGGNLLTGGLISATGNITSAANISGTYILGNGSQLTGLPATYGNSNVAAYLASGTDSSNIITTANVSGGNVLATTIVSGSSLLGSIASVSANITGGNVLTGGVVSATGNVTSAGNVNGTYLLGNVFYATGISASKIYNGTSEANIGTSGGNANVSIGGTSNVVVIYSGGMSVTGDLTVTGNATLSGNILGDRIVNGTTELDIQTAGGNANLTVGGTSNVVVWATTGEYVTGLISASGNITSAGNISGGNILGNGRNLTGVNTFSTISVSGQSDVVADSITDTLTLAAGTGISITTDAANDTITISSASTSSIFATGGSMGTVTESVTSSEDLGLITDAVSGTTYDLGTIAVDGVVTNDNIAFYTITGDKLANNLVYSSNLSVTGNITGNYIFGNGRNLTGLSGGSGFPGGSDTYVQFNDGGNFGGTAGLIFNKTTNALATTGTFSATGNITGNYFIGNGSQLTGISATGGGASNARVAGYSLVFGG